MRLESVAIAFFYPVFKGEDCLLKVKDAHLTVCESPILCS